MWDGIGIKVFLECPNNEKSQSAYLAEQQGIVNWRGCEYFGSCLGYLKQGPQYKRDARRAKF